MPSRTRQPKKTPKSKLLKPLSEGSDKDLNPHVFYAALMLLIGVRWWLGSGVPLIWDSQRSEVTGAFQSTWHLLGGNWLGPYTAGTLFSEPLLALVFAGFAALDLSVHSGLALVSAGAGLYFAMGLRRSGAHRWTALFGVGFALFHPAAVAASWRELGPETFWTVGGWIALSALLCTLSELRLKRNPGLHAVLFAGFGAGFLHWGDNSGIWAAVLVAMILAFTAGVPWSELPLTRRFPLALMLLLMPIGSTAAFRVLARTLNGRHYGVKIVDHRREGEFAQLQRNLARVENSEAQILAALPKWSWLGDSSQRLPSAEHRAERWAQSAYARGAYRTAPDAEVFFHRLNSEIERACQSALDCRPAGLNAWDRLKNSYPRLRQALLPNPAAGVARELASYHWVPTSWASNDRKPLSETASIDRQPSPLSEHAKAASVRVFFSDRVSKPVPWFLLGALLFVGLRASRRALRGKFGEWTLTESAFVGLVLFAGVEALLWSLGTQPAGVRFGFYSWLLGALGSAIFAETVLVSVRRRLDKLERDSRFAVDNPNYLRPTARAQRRAR